MTDDVREEMEMDENEMAEYASKILHYQPLFELSMAENY
jgi:hypothetical protein